MNDIDFLKLLRKGGDIDGLSPIGQGFSELSASYSNTDRPRLSVSETFQPRSLDWKILAFGMAARRSIFLQAVQQDLLDHLGEAVDPYRSR